MLTTTAIIAGVTFCLQGVNAWRGKKNAEKIREINRNFEEHVRKRNAEESKKLLQQMFDARKQIAEQEQQESLLLLKSSHDETIKDIAEKAFYSKWPLHIHPIVIRNDFPLYSIADLEKNDTIEPVHLILAPTRDKSFKDTVEPIITEKLNDVFYKFYNSRNSHRVIFYKDVWIDETLDADETIVRNIYSRTKLTPTILISFKIKNDRIVLEVSHWGINGLDRPLEKTGSVFCQNIEVPIWGSSISRNKTYDITDVEIISSQVADFVSLITGLLVDKLMWYRYRLSPVLPNMIKNGMLKLGSEELGIVDGFYSNLLSDSFESGFISRYVDYRQILSFCQSVDIPLNENHNLLNIFFSNDQIATFSAFPTEIQYYILNYIGFNKILYQAESTNKVLIQSLYRIWLTTALRNAVVNAAANDPEYSLGKLQDNFGAAYWKLLWDDKLLSVAHTSTDSALLIIQPINKVMFPRIKMRESLANDTEKAIIESIIPSLCQNTIKQIEVHYQGKFKSLIKAKLKDLIPDAEKLESMFNGVDLTFDLSLFNKGLHKDLMNSLKASLSKLNISSFAEGFKSNVHEILTSLDSWTYKTSEDWIEYHFFGCDVLRNNLSENARKNQDSRILNDFDSLSIVILKSFIRKIKRLNTNYNVLALATAIALTCGVYGNIGLSLILNKILKKE